MNQYFCTPVPSGRISINGKLELRIAGDDVAYVHINVFQNYAVIRDCGNFDVAGNRAETKLYPDLKGIIGQIVIEIRYYDTQGIQKKALNIPYEIVSSDVHSTCLLDGCWVTLYHWSEAEGRYFNAGLKKLTDDDWRQVVRSMHKIGITSILIQNVFDSEYYAYQHQMTADHYAGKAFYPSKIYPERMDIAASDPIEAILSEADQCNMAVFPGVGLYAWFDFSPESLEWHKRVTQELFDRYGHHPSLYGWYISEEMMGDLYYTYDPVPDEKYQDIIDFFAEYKKFVSRLTPTKPVAMAPDNVRMQCYRKQWLPILKNIDILIPFAFARTENNVAEIAKLTAETGTHFWVDMEIFANPFDDGLVPKTYEDLIKEIHQYDVLEQVYGYQYTGLLNEPGYRKNVGEERTEELYVKYLDYQQKVRNLQKK